MIWKIYWCVIIGLIILGAGQELALDGEPIVGKKHSFWPRVLGLLIFSPIFYFAFTEIFFGRS